VQLFFFDLFVVASLSRSFRFVVVVHVVYVVVVVAAAAVPAVALAVPEFIILSLVSCWGILFLSRMFT